MSSKHRKATTVVLGVDTAGALCRIPAGAVISILSNEGEFVEVLWQGRFCRISRTDVHEKTVAAE